MKAVVQDRYGPPDVLRLPQGERPGPQGGGGPRIKIHATTVCRTDTGLRSGMPFISRFFTGLLRPKRILGVEFAGEVEEVGAAVTEFTVGDHVFGGRGFDAHAEFVCIAESAPLAHKPAGMSFDEAAAVFDGASLALVCLEKAGPLEGL